jgi:hypothetical protein
MIRRDDGDILSPERHGLLIGEDVDGKKIHLEPHRGSVLIAGSSGIGKSTLATALTERMAEKRFEFCVFDPEGDYSELEDAVSVGNAKEAPNSDEVLKLLNKVGANVVVNTQALEAADRPPFFAKLLPQIASLRTRTGRPHWLIVDEAHHLLPSERENAAQIVADDVPAAIFITVHPDAVATAALKRVETVVTLGPAAEKAIVDFCRAVGVEVPGEIAQPDKNQVLFWRPRGAEAPRLVTAIRPKQSRKRHSRKYAEGELPESVSFYFRGPDRKLKLRAHNLTMFSQLAGGIDDETWDHHLRAGEYSAWFRDVIKDEELADEAAAVEADGGLKPAESRERIIQAVSRRYTAPARSREV